MLTDYKEIDEAVATAVLAYLEIYISEKRVEGRRRHSVHLGHLVRSGSARAFIASQVEERWAEALSFDHEVPIQWVRHNGDYMLQFTLK